jgi:hypothetical protein
VGRKKKLKGELESRTVIPDKKKIAKGKRKSSLAKRSLVGADVIDD